MMMFEVFLTTDGILIAASLEGEDEAFPWDDILISNFRAFLWDFIEKSLHVASVKRG